jgi:sugar lactone lactonase YvrE
VSMKISVVTSVLVFSLIGWSIAQAQQIEQVIRTLDGTQPLIRPVQVALSPSGSRLAIVDQQGGRIHVIDSDGNPIWTIGAGSVVVLPVLICFERDDALLYYVKSEKTIFRAWESNPDSPDMVTVVSDSALDGFSLDRVIALDKGQRGFVVLDRDKGTVIRLKPDWTMDKKLISPGSGKGRLWSPTDIAADLSGNIIVSDESGCPVQAFTSDGRPLFCGSWNLSEAQRTWNSTTVGMGPGETIWATDITNLCWRVFDRAGIQIAEYPFQPPLFKPNSFAITTDNRMFVADDNGTIIVMSLP